MTYNEHMTKTTIEVVNDHLIETHHWQRKIAIKGAKKIKHRDGDGIVTTYTANHLILVWINGNEPTHVTVHGTQENAMGNLVNYRKRYKITKAPRWVKDILDA